MEGVELFFKIFYGKGANYNLSKSYSPWLLVNGGTCNVKIVKSLLSKESASETRG